MRNEALEDKQMKIISKDKPTNNTSAEPVGIGVAPNANLCPPYVSNLPNVKHVNAGTEPSGHAGVDLAA
jgi:hypothetical protein